MINNILNNKKLIYINLLKLEKINSKSVKPLT